MSLRIDTSDWISGALVIGGTGLGVPAETVPSTGADGPGYVYPSLSLPADNGKEICGRITTEPAHGVLLRSEDTACVYMGTGVADTANCQLYVDGVATGTPFAIDFPIRDPISLVPGARALVLTGYVPTVAKAPTSLTPAPAAMTVAGYAPAITYSNAAPPLTLQPLPCMLTLTGYAPTVRQSLTLAPGAASLAFTGYAPYVDQYRLNTHRPTPASLVLRTFVPVVTQGVFPKALALDSAVVAEVGSSGFLRRFTKTAAESRSYDVDFNLWLSSIDDELEDIGLEVEAGLSWGNPRHAGGIARIDFWGGTAGVSYAVYVGAWTSGGRYKRVAIQVRVT